ncbi:MAG: endonuclease domain-containing protein [Nevskiales bacterium]
MPDNTNPSFTRTLRRNQTEAEIPLWYHLRNRRLAGAKFRRHFPIGPYVADFICLERSLIVEADGGQHAEQISKDRIRTRYLKSRDYRILRFWNHAVLQDIEAVLLCIARALTPALSQRERELSSARPRPHCQREKGSGRASSPPLPLGEGRGEGLSSRNEKP